MSRPSPVADAAAEPSEDEPATNSRRRLIIGAAILGIIILALVLLGREAASLVPRFAAWVEAQGAWAPVLFIGGYALATVAVVPGAVLTLAAGAIWGLWRGTLIAFSGALLGSTAAFLVARYLARDRVADRLAENQRFHAIDRAVGEQGRKIVFLLRLSPVFPFNLLNYALGVSGVRLRDYLLASLGMIPGTVLYVYYGKVAGDVAALAGGAGVERGTGYWVVLGLGLLATIAVTALVTRLARRALNEAVGE